MSPLAATVDRSHGTYSDLETLSPDKRRAHQWERLSRLLSAAAAKSGEFKARMERAGLKAASIRSLDDWPKIPLFRKKELIGLQQSAGIKELLTVAPGELSRIYQSPGPIFDPEGREPDYWGWTEAFHSAGFRSGDLVQMTFSYHLTPAGLMLEEPLKELGCAVIPAGPGNTEVQLELLTKLPVTGFVGMASYLKIIKDRAKKLGLDIRKDIVLDVAFVAAERLAPSLRQELEEEMGMLVRQGYGTADVGCAAYECIELSGMHLSSRALIEIVDPKTGEPVPDGELGEVVITPFTTAYPLVRLATGDLSRLVVDACPCGRTSARLAGILGRVDDTAKVKGQFIYPHQAAEALAAFPQIAAWQIVVENPGGRDTVALKLKLSADVEPERVQKAFQDKCKLRPEIRIVGSDDLPEGAPPLVDERSFE